MGGGDDGGGGGGEGIDIVGVQNCSELHRLG